MEGCHVPFKVKYNKGDLITVDDVKGPEQAKNYSGKKFYLHKDQFNENDFHQKNNPLTELTSYSIKHGSFEGKIIAIHKYPKQVLAELSVNGKSQLIPLHEQLIISMDHDQKIIKMELPDGIFNI